MKPQKMQPRNPFLVYGYANPRYFCDREAETRQMLSALENERNLTLIAPRRMGKTGLIKKCLLYPARGETGSCQFLYGYFCNARFSFFRSPVGKNRTRAA